ncbi:beta-lactamase family protein [Microvirga sp. ACRRW]|uniref:serine hydrolase domain-containing protein n=1 Tax=Microvirga sp. ACRRW TaxID=2918205 RepID=UPI001EF58B44|nr:serine hydrolase [Microvirga sp. ACRRW]MCG7391799.1 beta-lactamase family protein [Microvirga sp. ACRRW]
MTAKPSPLISSALKLCLILAMLAAPSFKVSAQTFPAPMGAPSLDQSVERAKELENLRSLIISRDGKIVVEQAFKGSSLERPTNIKSASKTILSALVGIAIERGVLKGVDQPVAEILAANIPPDADERVKHITIGHLLSMRAGLERTSGRNYGAWVSSGNWVRHVLTRPFVDEPGGRMLYSTGSTHLLSAALTRASKRSTLELAREWLGEPLEVQVPPWTRDPQGIFLGGNEMAMSPRALLRFGEMYRQGGMIDGKRVVSETWVKQSWEPRTSSPFTGDAYGYGWYMRDMRGHRVYYAWGFGGQMIYVAPSLNMTIVMTSDPTEPSREDNYIGQLHALVADSVIPALRSDEATGSL